MEHPAELLVHSYLDEARQGLTTMSEENIQGIVKHVEQAVRKQFKTGESRKDFRLRASNIGKASCQLWFQKHKPEEPEKVETEIAGEKIKGEYDLVLDNKVDDIKSTSPWSYKNKWIDGESIENSDPFGYVGQLTIYAKGKGVEAGGWWVVNHSSGEFKYIKYTSDPDVVIKKLEKTVEEVSNGKFVRCFSPVKETFHRKETGRHVLNTQCKFCNFRHACWGDRLTEQASTVSKAKNKPIVNYISM